MKRDQVSEVLMGWLQASKKGDAQRIWKEDKLMIEWLEKEQNAIQEGIKSLRHSFLRQQAEQMVKEDTSATVEALLNVLGSLSPEKKRELLGSSYDRLKSVL